MRIVERKFNWGISTNYLRSKEHLVYTKIQSSRQNLYSTHIEWLLLSSKKIIENMILLDKLSSFVSINLKLLNKLHCLEVHKNMLKVEEVLAM